MTSDGDPLLDKPEGAPDWVPSVDDERSISRLWWLVALVLGAGVLVFIVRSADGPANPSFEATPTSGSSSTTATTVPGATSLSTASTVAGVAPVERPGLEGFGEIAVTIQGADGSFLERCLLLAATGEQRSRGLMTVTDESLGGYDGMLFHFGGRDSTASFYMRNTPMPLSIAFVDAAGGLVSVADMEPCPDQDGCPTYPAAGPYRYAIEVPRGRLPEVGIVEGATITPRDGACSPPTA